MATIWVPRPASTTGQARRFGHSGKRADLLYGIGYARWQVVANLLLCHAAPLRCRKGCSVPLPARLPSSCVIVVLSAVVAAGTIAGCSGPERGESAQAPEVQASRSQAQ